MRSVTVVLALAAVCAASPALAQARILTVQDETQPLRLKRPVAAQHKASGPAALARHHASTLPTPPHMRPPPASIPVPPQQAQNLDRGSVQAPQAAPPVQPAPPRVQPPPISEHRKSQERVESKPPLPPPVVGRYSFNRVDDGFLRLDKATGQIAYCSPHTAGWGCQAVPENRVALEKEVVRLREQVASLQKLKDEMASLKKLKEEVAALKSLRDEVDSLKDLQAEVAALKKEIAALRPPPPPRPPAPIPPPAGKPDKNSIIKRPSDQDLTRARDYIAYTWHRLVDMINQFQKDVMGRRGSEGADGPSRT